MRKLVCADNLVRIVFSSGCLEYFKQLFISLFISFAIAYRPFTGDLNISVRALTDQF